MVTYLTALENYDEVHRSWDECGRQTPEPKRPECPRPLQLWLDCDAGHCNLVAGGTLDQPFLLALFVNTAGAVYTRVTDANAIMAARQAQNEQRRSNARGFPTEI